jgi:hypothetical protein
MSVLQQSFAWAIVTRAGQLARLSNVCPIYWRRYVAQHECNRQTRLAKNDDAFHVEKVSILAVHR